MFDHKTRKLIDKINKDYEEFLKNDIYTDQSMDNLYLLNNHPINRDYKFSSSQIRKHDLDFDKSKDIFERPINGYFDKISMKNLSKRQSYLRPVGLCKINGKKFQYLFDTGAQATVMDYKLFKKLNISKKYIRKSTSRINSANAIIKTIGEIDLQFELGEYKFDVTVKLVEGLFEYNQIIMGTNAMYSCEYFRQTLMEINYFIRKTSNELQNEKF